MAKSILVPVFLIELVEAIQGASSTAVSESSPQLFETIEQLPYWLPHILLGIQLAAPCTGAGEALRGMGAGITCS